MRITRQQSVQGAKQLMADIEERRRREAEDEAHRCRCLDCEDLKAEVERLKAIVGDLPPSVIRNLNANLRDRIMEYGASQCEKYGVYSATSDCTTGTTPEGIVSTVVYATSSSARIASAEFERLKRFVDWVAQCFVDQLGDWSDRDDFWTGVELILGKDVRAKYEAEASGVPQSDWERLKAIEQAARAVVDDNRYNADIDRFDKAWNALSAALEVSK